jgi:hypothetical protein
MTVDESDTHLHFKRRLLWLWIALLLRQLSTMRTFAQAQKLPAQEMQALQDLYDTTGGFHWKWSTPSVVYGYPWNFSTSNQNPCSASTPWQGIGCTSTCITTSCHVITLSLDSMTLKGKSSFFDFKPNTNTN